MADQLLPIAVIDQRRLRHRADEDLKELRIDRPAAAGLAFAGVLISSLLCRRVILSENRYPLLGIMLVYCSGAEGAFAPASAISVMVMSVRARVAWSGDLSSACFSGGPQGSSWRAR